jgi:hypothetical protein
LFLKLDHDESEFIGTDFSPHAFLADFPVLAKDTPQITASEENRPRSVAAAQGFFLAVVLPIAGNTCQRASSTHSSFRGLITVNSAMVGAQVTIAQMLSGQLNPVLQFTGGPEAEVCGLELHNSIDP